MKKLGFFDWGVIISILLFVISLIVLFKYAGSKNVHFNIVCLDCFEKGTEVEFSDDDNYCSSCGKQNPAFINSYSYCSTCKKQYSSEKEYCPKDGTKVTYNQITKFENQEAFQTNQAHRRVCSRIIIWTIISAASSLVFGIAILFEGW